MIILIKLLITSLNNSWIQFLKNLLYSTFAPGFGGGGSNAAFISMGLVDASQRKRSQDQIAQQMTNMFRRLNNVRVFAVQEQTISVGTGGRGAFPVQFVFAEFEF